MRRVAPLLVLLALPALFACAGPSKPSTEEDFTVSSSTTWEPYTRHRLVSVDGEARGYLVSYDPIPIHAQGEVSRVLPTGSHRILDGRFHDVGFITSTFEVHRHGDHGDTRSLGVTKSLESGLGLFYQGSNVMLRPLTAGSAPH